MHAAPLTDLAKARVDRSTKQALDILQITFGHRKEADIIRQAFREFIQAHREHLPRTLQPAVR